MNQSNISQIVPFKVKDSSEVFLLDGSMSETGTLKDVRAKEIIIHCMKNKIDKIVLITAGNMGYSLGYFSRDTPIKIVNIIDKNLKNSIKNKLKSVSHKVIGVNLQDGLYNSREIIDLGRESPNEKVFDATHGFYKSYENLVDNFLLLNPDVVITPIGSGATFLGLCSGIRKKGMKTKVVGIDVKNKNSSFADKLTDPLNPYNKLLREEIERGNQIIKISEQEAKLAYESAKNNSLNMEPSSSIVLHYLIKNCGEHTKLGRILILNTGRGSF